MKKKIKDYLNLAAFKPEQTFWDRMLLGLYGIYGDTKNYIINSNSEILSRTYLHTRYLKRKALGGNATFVSTEDLVVWTNQWIPSLPKTYDVIIGLPRSGLLVANIIALRLGRPLTTPELFCRDEFWLSRRSFHPGATGMNILLVDDFVQSGKSMADAYRLVKSAAPDSHITTASLIVYPRSANKVDLFHKIIPGIKLFEWDVLDTKAGKLVSDLDGVLAENCPPGYDRHEELYQRWLIDCKPYVIPAFEIDVILSCRLEKYRPQTEAWLQRHQIRYKELILWDLPCKSQRQGQNAQFKINHIIRITPHMVWESSYHEAKEIWEKTKVPTLCTDEMIMFT